MLQTDLWRQQLALEKRSVSEIATALSIVAVAGATLYNIGYFAPVERSLVSLLTVQDLLFGTAIALLPMVGAVVLSFTISRWIKAAPERPRLAIVLGLASLLAGTFGFKYFFYSTPPSTLGHLGSAYVALAGLAALINLLAKSTALSTIWVALSLIYLPYSIGAATSISVIGNPTRAISEIRTDKETVSGTILRLTSAYVLIFDGRSVLTLPLSKVLSVRRIYRASPGEEFLQGAQSPSGSALDAENRSPIGEQQ